LERLFWISRAAMVNTSAPSRPCVSKLLLTALTIWVVISMPKSAEIRAASNSSSAASSSRGERETMRLISWASLLWVFCRPDLNLEKRLVIGDARWDQEPHPLCNDGRRDLPLPKGEGRGEGELRVRIPRSSA